MPRLLVTGASGFLGTEVVARATGWDVTGTWLTHAPPGLQGLALDVRDATAVARAVAAARPDAVIHTAYRQDDDATTGDGAIAVARAARAAGARLVHLSTDLVFGGGDGTPLDEEAPVGPRSPYGAAKLAAERAIAALDPGAVLVRTSLIYGGPGHRPSKHEEAALAAARGQRDMAFFVNELRTPVQVGDLADALLELAAGRAAHGPLHVAGPDVVDRHAFAALVARAAGLDPAGLRTATSGPERPGPIALSSARATGCLRRRLRGVREVLAPVSGG